VIADDFTGAVDAAAAIRDAGLGVQLVFGDATTPAEERADAIVVALKSRSASVDEAVSASRTAYRTLSEAGASRVFFKYCSTFDSTAHGNIGPVIDVLLEEAGEQVTVVCPAAPGVGRTMYQGHLFVHQHLLNESGMEHHPINPMLDSSILRLTTAQTARRVVLVPLTTVRDGVARVEETLDELAASGGGVAVVDAVDDGDLGVIAAACRALRIVTGAAGLVGAVARLAADAGARLPAASVPADGAEAVISGSCSATSREQVEVACAEWPSLEVDPLAVAEGWDVRREVEAWAGSRLADGPVLIYSTGTPEAVRAAQRMLGSERCRLLVERALADAASGLVDAGVRRLVVAGGETAGSVIQKLDLRRFNVGPRIDEGVAWCVPIGAVGPAVALKSGNFGGTRFFADAFEVARRARAGSDGRARDVRN